MVCHICHVYLLQFHYMYIYIFPCIMYLGIMFKIKGRNKEMSSKFIKNADIHAPGRTQALKTMGTAHNVTLPHDRLTCFTNIEFICLYILCRLLKKQHRVFTLDKAENCTTSLETGLCESSFYPCNIYFSFSFLKQTQLLNFSKSQTITCST